MLIFGPLAGLMGLFAIYVATRRGDFRIERSLDIDAPAAKLFALIDDFHAWAKWSPWEKIDPAMARTYEGPSAGKGATYRWRGNNKAGEGSMVILESQPDTRIEIALTFVKPFAASNKAIFTLTPGSAGKTHVTWAMEGHNGFMAKAFGVFVNMDKLVGADFERGLAAMREVAGASA